LCHATRDSVRCIKKALKLIVNHVAMRQDRFSPRELIAHSELFTLFLPFFFTPTLRNPQW
jgi:hypothetical protein